MSPYINICSFFVFSEEILQSQSMRLDNSKCISSALEEIVRGSAWNQTVKNALTAGFKRSILYSFTKISKMFKSLRLGFI